MTILTLEEAASFLKMTSHYLRYQAKQGIIPGKKLGREWRFVQEVLEEFFVSHITDYEQRCMGKNQGDEKKIHF